MPGKGVEEGREKAGKGSRRAAGSRPKAAEGARKRRRRKGAEKGAKRAMESLTTGQTRCKARARHKVALLALEA